MKTAILIPCYNAGHTVIATARHAAKFGPVIVINDGSTDSVTTAALGELTAPITVLHHEVNRGKGAALRTGFEWIMHHTSYDAVITVDADGQHDPDEIPRFIAAQEATRASLILGNRELHHAEQPLIRRLGHLLTRGGLRIATGQTIPDSQCGYRLYSRAILPSMLRIQSAGYNWETDALLYALKNKHPVTSIPIRTIYTPHAHEHSHFNYIGDTIRITASIVRYLM